MFLRASLVQVVLATATLPAIGQTPPSQRFDAHVGYSELSGDRGTWHEATATYSSTFDNEMIAAIQIETHERFGIDERFAEIRLSQRLGSSRVQLAAGGAGEGVFKARLSLRAGVEADVGAPSDGWTILGDVGASWFSDNEALALKVGVERRFSRDGWFGRMQLVSIADRGGTAPTGYLLQVGGPVASGITLRVGYADVVEPEQLELVRVQGWSTSLVFEINDHWQWRLDGISEERESVGRNEIGVGVARRF